jgi:hypothetical protein
VWHPTLKVAEIQAVISLTPRISNTVGENRKTPTGNALDGVYKYSYCTFELSKGTESNIEEEIARCNKELSKHNSFLQTVRASGGCAEYFLGLFFDGNSGFTIPNDQLRAMHELGIDLSLDIYSGTSKS